jgi:hypothetical protein
MMQVSCRVSCYCLSHQLHALGILPLTSCRASLSRPANGSPGFDRSNRHHSRGETDAHAQRHRCSCLSADQQRTIYTLHEPAIMALHVLSLGHAFDKAACVHMHASETVRKLQRPDCAASKTPCTRRSAATPPASSVGSCSRAAAAALLRAAAAVGELVPRRRDKMHAALYSTQASRGLQAESTMHDVNASCADD